LNEFETEFINNRGKNILQRIFKTSSKYLVIDACGDEDNDMLTAFGMPFHIVYDFRVKNLHNISYVDDDEKIVLVFCLPTMENQIKIKYEKSVVVPLTIREQEEYKTCKVLEFHVPYHKMKSFKNEMSYVFDNFRKWKEFY
jgi:hypothetical protein